jgi:hypothetical protein
MRRFLLGLVATLVVAFVVIQLVPYGRDHENPPVASEPNWDSPQTREMAVIACFDCHSNETSWPWYSNIAPFSWRLQNHVDEGRDKLNFSEWGSGEEEDEITDSVVSGEMPPWDYTLLHPDANFTGADREAFISGLTATFGGGEGGESGESGGEHAWDDD